MSFAANEVSAGDGGSPSLILPAVPSSQNSLVGQDEPATPVGSGSGASPAPVQAPGRNYKNTSNEHRRAIYDYLLQRCSSGNLKHGSFSAAASEFGFDPQTIRRIWKQGQQSLADGSIMATLGRSNLYSTP